MTGWALDLGTTNSGVARWDEGRGQPPLVELPEVQDYLLELRASNNDVVEPYASHPELEGERLVMSAAAQDGPLYYEVGVP